MTTTSRKVYISIPEQLLKRLDDFAGREQRTRSGLIQEAVRDFLEAEENRRLARHHAFALMETARSNVEKSGVTPEQMDKIIQQAVNKVRAKRKQPTPRTSR